MMWLGPRGLLICPAKKHLYIYTVVRLEQSHPKPTSLLIPFLLVWSTSAILR
jgi:hypothetical protein